jgi:hypothetical protein
MPTDDVGGWARERDRADGSNGRTLVLVGSSRMQLGFDTRSFAQATGIQPIQLAIDGDTGIDVLRDLATDRNFRGTVICELMEKYLIVIGADPSETQAGQWLHEYHAGNLFSRFEWRAGGLTQAAFAFRLPDLWAQNLAANLRLGHLPPRPFVTIAPDRSKAADYGRADLASLRAQHLTIVRAEYARMSPWSSEAFAAQGKPLADWAAQIEGRGGKVIFVRFPTSGEIRKLEDAKFPKSDYWDVMVAANHLNAINGADYDSLKSFTCPDGTHLDQRDRAVFTQALARILLDKKLLPVAGGPH